MVGCVAVKWVPSLRFAFSCEIIGTRQAGLKNLDSGTLATMWRPMRSTMWGFRKDGVWIKFCICARWPERLTTASTGLATMEPLLTSRWWRWTMFCLCLCLYLYFVCEQCFVKEPLLTSRWWRWRMLCLYFVCEKCFVKEPLLTSRWWRWTWKAFALRFWSFVKKTFHESLKCLLQTISKDFNCFYSRFAYFAFPRWCRPGVPWSTPAALRPPSPPPSPALLELQGSSRLLPRTGSIPALRWTPREFVKVKVISGICRGLGCK